MAGKSNPEIVKMLNSSKSTVSDAVNRYKKLETSDDQPRSRKPQTAHTPVKIKAIREWKRKNPKKRIRKMTRDIKINEKTVRTIVKENLKMSPFKLSN